MVPATAHEPSHCDDHSVAASAVSTPGETRAFVRCAAEYLETHGPEEAHRAFHEDERWRHGSIYVSVDGILPTGAETIAYVYPPDPSREGVPWGDSVDGFGSDPFREVHRLLSVVDAGWMYSSILNPETGRQEPKTSYVVEVDWNGHRAAMGAGLYRPDVPGACKPEEVNASDLTAMPSEARLREFVRCAALLLETSGYAARDALESDPRWRHGSTYAFVLDMEGNQILTGNRLRVNGKALHEWGAAAMPLEQFGGRDMIAIGRTFGEALIYYRGRDPRTWATQPRAAMLKRISAYGVPLLVGAQYDVSLSQPGGEATCAANRVAARAIRTREDLQAFVRCAAEYIAERGTKEAHRAFHEDERWRHGPYYLFVNLLAQPHERAISHISVFPPNPSWEGTSQLLVDNFGTDYYYELHRVMQNVDAGWLHYAFTNFTAGRSEPKSTYVVEIDWDGHRAVVGAGVYERDLPGTCEPEVVNAAALAASPSEEGLQEFVRCAAVELETQGYFGTISLATNPRWRSDPVHLFGLDSHGSTFFTGDPDGPAAGTGASELRPAGGGAFGGRDVVGVGDTFGETFLYSSATAASTGAAERKVTFVKRVLVHGLPLLLGASYPARD